MGNGRTSSIVLWIIAGLLFLLSFLFLPNGEIGPFITGLAVSAALAFWGYRKFNKNPQSVSSPAVNNVSPGAPYQNQATVQPALQQAPMQMVSPNRYCRIKVAGVTFKNGQRSRQSILRKINFRDPPFDNGVKIELQPYEWEGARAFGIYANGEQIGSIPAEDVDYVEKNSFKFDHISIEIYGGQPGQNYGAELLIKLKPQ